MTSDLALDYISRRMQEMGHGKKYLLRFRHILLKEAEVREVTAYNQIFILIEPIQTIRIESDVGLFDLNEDHANEIQYEHPGKNKDYEPVTITNERKILTSHPHKRKQ